MEKQATTAKDRAKDENVLERESAWFVDEAEPTSEGSTSMDEGDIEELEMIDLDQM